MQTTPLTLREQLIYSVFTRNYSPEGTLQAVTNDLDRIHFLGTDILWLLPFYPSGQVHRKGTLGSPYAIKDYRTIDPAQGTLADLEALVAAAHQRGMKVIIDIVYNHTSPDSVLATTHPEWFYHKANGEMGNHVGDWYDVVDLDYTQPALWDYQIETLVYWAQYVDGFRCDVASLIPLAFWKQARQAVEAAHPGTIWLAESVERNFITTLRSQQLTALSDSELYEAFDMTYDYDVSEVFKAYRDGEGKLSDYITALDQQDTTYPANYVKMHHLENHDNDRIAAHVSDPQDWWQWHAFLYCLKGATLLYNGQERQATATPSLFDAAPIDWQTGQDQTERLKALAALKKRYLPTENTGYTLSSDDATDTVIVHYEQASDTESDMMGIFNLRHHKDPLTVPLKDGTYQNLLTETPLTVTNGQIASEQTPAWLRLPKTH